MPAAIMVGSAASANQTASATTGFSAATLPHLLIAVLAIAGVMTMGGGLLLFGSGFSAAPQSLVGSLPGTWFTVTGVRCGNESWIGDFLRGVSSPSQSLAGPARPTAKLRCLNKSTLLQVNRVANELVSTNVTLNLAGGRPGRPPVQFFGP